MKLEFFVKVVIIVALCQQAVSLYQTNKLVDTIQSIETGVSMIADK